MAGKFLKVLEPRLIARRRCGNVIHHRRVFLRSSAPVDPHRALLGNWEEGEGTASPPAGSTEKKLFSFIVLLFSRRVPGVFGILSRGGVKQILPQPQSNQQRVLFFPGD